LEKAFTVEDLRSLAESRNYKLVRKEDHYWLIDRRDRLPIANEADESYTLPPMKHGNCWKAWPQAERTDRERKPGTLAGAGLGKWVYKVRPPIGWRPSRVKAHRQMSRWLNGGLSRKSGSRNPAAE
jgi:hypothetical protein